MKEEFYKYKENTNEDEYQAYSWLPKGEVRCVLQIVHGNNALLSIRDTGDLFRLFLISSHTQERGF